MAKIEQIGNLQVEQDLQFQRLEWRVERIGKVLMVLFLIAAVCGLLGTGYFSQARTASGSGSIVVHYDRFTRREAPSRLMVEASGKPNSELHLWFSESHIEELKVEEIIPEQVSTESSPGRTTYVFQTGDDGKARVRFHVQPQNAGTVEGHIGVDGGDEVKFWSFVYP